MTPSHAYSHVVRSQHAIVSALAFAIVDAGLYPDVISTHRRVFDRNRCPMYSTERIPRAKHEGRSTQPHVELSIFAVGAKCACTREHARRGMDELSSGWLHLRSMPF